MECDTSPGPETHVEYTDLCGYIFQITCMLPRILVYCNFCCVTASVQERGSLTTVTQCTCQTSAVTLYFSPWLFTHLSPADISDETDLFVQHSLHINSVSSMLLPACLNGAECGCWTAILLPDGTNGHCALAHCSLSHLKNIHLMWPKQTLRVYSLLNNRWPAINGYNRTVILH